MKNTLVILLVAVACVYSYGQRVEAGIFTGMSVYSGDLSPKVISRYTQFMNPVGGVALRLRGRGVVGARLGFNYTHLEGDDARSAHPGRQLSFRTQLLEASALAEWYLIPDNFLGDEPAVTPYLFTGLTVFHFNPVTELDGYTIELQPVGTEGQGLEGYEPPYERTQLAIPYGIGLRIKLNRKSSLSVELSGRKLFTDYLDDVSDEIVDYSVIYEEKGQEAARISRPGVDPDEPQPAQYYRRGGSRLDSYAMLQLGYMYRLGR